MTKIFEGQLEHKISLTYSRVQKTVFLTNNKLFKKTIVFLNYRIYFNKY